jgi:hypothetical protein
MSDIQAPQIVTVDTLKTFQAELVQTLGLTLSNKSLIQNNSNQLTNISYSAAIGSGHSTDSTRGLKNVLVSGQNNIVSSWNQAVFGQYNKSNKDALFIIGTGVSDSQRNNAFEVLKSGEIVLGSKLLANEPVTINNIISYDIDTLDVSTEPLSLPQIQEYLNKFTDTDLIPAGIIKKIVEQIPNSLGLNDVDISSFIKDLTFAGSTTDAQKYALSVAAGKKLEEDIRLMETTFNGAKTLQEDFNKLRKQISYLFNCLVVNKLSNESYKTDAEPLIEQYAVGIADFALDYDTNFTIDNDITTTIIPNATTEN